MARHEKIVAAVRARHDELVALARALVRVPTTNPPGENYHACARLLGDRLAARDFEVSYFRAEGSPGDSDRYPRINLIARRTGAGSGPCVHFNSHLDVVPVGAGWSVDPFAGEIRGDRLFGRGACDMKGGLAASVIAVEALIEAIPDFPGALEISGTADEETGGFGGVAWLAEQGILAHPRVDHVIIPEPLGRERICLGHRGCWWGEIEVGGRIAHGSMPFLGDCAVRHMGAVLHEVETRLYPALAARRTALPVIPEEARTSTLNINALHGGQAEDFEGFLASCVPDSCRLTVDRRYHEPETAETVAGELRALLARVAAQRGGFPWELRELWSVPPTATDRDAPVARALAGAIHDVSGNAPGYVLSPGTYDQKHIDRIGHLKDCVAYGPGRLELAHQPDEFIEISDMMLSAEVMALAAARLLGAGIPDAVPAETIQQVKENP